MSFADRLKAEDVCSVETFAEYAQQQTGVPYPTGKGIAALRKAVKDFFDMYPHTDWMTLVRIVEWVKFKRKRYATPDRMLRGAFRMAFEDGWIPEIIPDPDIDIDSKIRQAMEQETDPAWHKLFMNAHTSKGKHEVYESWLKNR
jgi:hypothetical protein